MRCAVRVRTGPGLGAAGAGPSRARVLGVACILLSVAFSAAALSGCGAGGSAPAAGGPSALLSTLENWSALETPVEDARGILTQECMARHGFRYVPFPQAGQPGGQPAFASPLFGTSLWLGPQSLAWRIVNGWGLYEQTMQQLGQPGGFFGGVPQEIRIMQSLRGRAMQTYQRTLFGGGKTMKIRIPGLPHFTIQIGGCNTTAGTRLFGSVAASVAVPQYGPSILNGSVQGSAARSPAVLASEANWAACVRARTGIKTRAPSQLFMHFYGLYQSKGPTPAVHREELHAAVADLRCQERSHLAQSVRQAALLAIRHLPAPVMGELQTLLGALDQARSRARALFAHPVTSGAATTGAGRSGSTGPSGATAPSGATVQGASTVQGGATGSAGSVVVYGG